MVLLRQVFRRRREENVRSEVADVTGNVKYNRGSLWTFPSSVLVTGVLLKALQMALTFVT